MSNQTRQALAPENETRGRPAAPRHVCARNAIRSVTGVNVRKQELLASCRNRQSSRNPRRHSNPSRTESDPDAEVRPRPSVRRSNSLGRRQGLPEETPPPERIRRQSCGQGDKLRPPPEKPHRSTRERSAAEKPRTLRPRRSAGPRAAPPERSAGKATAGMPPCPPPPRCASAAVGPSNISAAPGRTLATPFDAIHKSPKLQLLSMQTNGHS